MFNRQFFIRLFTVVVLIALQSFIFNNISFQNLATPFLAIWFVIRYGVDTNRYQYLIWSFLLGTGIDFLDGTPGIHAFSLVFVAFIRPVVMNLFSKKYQTSEVVEVAELSWIQYLIYIVILILIYHLLVFFFYDLKLSQPVLLLQKTLYSSILSTIFVVIVSLFIDKPKN